MKDKLKQLQETLEKADQQLRDIRKDTAGLSGIHCRLIHLINDLTVVIEELEDGDR